MAIMAIMAIVMAIMAIVMAMMAIVMAIRFSMMAINGHYGYYYNYGHNGHLFCNDRQDTYCTYCR